MKTIMLIMLTIALATTTNNVRTTETESYNKDVKHISSEVFNVRKSKGEKIYKVLYFNNKKLYKYLVWMNNKNKIKRIYDCKSRVDNNLQQICDFKTQPA